MLAKITQQGALRCMLLAKNIWLMKYRRTEWMRRVEQTEDSINTARLLYD
jgi:hypothetical protein